ncbi:hypothetical protein [Ochrobactrum quorumnocens]|uniref:hypothetical protein n=1 Tax=Ochrobactrum quorumnocens TaxID=271865 RepID=UPI003BA16220
MICYDNNIVENARATALMGTDILLVPHETGGCQSLSPRGWDGLRRSSDSEGCIVPPHPFL